MNNARRAEIRRAMALVAEAKDILETCASEEREYYDNMPEAIQAGDKGSRADQVATDFEGAASSLDEIDLDDDLS